MCTWGHGRKYNVFRSAEARVAQARTALSRTEIAVDDARRTLDETRITADFAGTLSDLAVTEGGLVSNNEELATLIDEILVGLVEGVEVMLEEYLGLGVGAFGRGDGEEGAYGVGT